MNLGLPVLLPITVLMGIALLVSASKATAHVHDGAAFVRWMLVVFAAFAGLVALPLLASA